MQKSYQVQVSGIFMSYRYEPSVEVPPDINHCHDTYEILYVLEGRGRYIVEGSAYEMHAGTVIIVPPFAYHRVEIPRHAPYERYVINFCAGAPHADAEDLFGEGGVEQTGFYASSPMVQTLLGVLERGEVALQLPEECRRAYLRALLSEMLVLLSSMHADSDMPDNRRLGARVIRYLNEHIGDELNLDKIAKHFFVSKYYLCRAFKKHNGISIHGYLTQKRVMYAKQLIEAGETASGAAYRVGFGDYSAFYRAYVKIVGQSPLAGQKKRTP